MPSLNEKTPPSQRPERDNTLILPFSVQYSLTYIKVQHTLPNENQTVIKFHIYLPFTFRGCLLREVLNLLR